MTDTKTVGAGTVLAGRYEIADVIGHGGFGTVYKARQMNMDRDVAVKILPPQFLAVNDVVERFKREAKLASRLRHPNTITLHDYGQHENLLYIVMELLVGEDLADLLKREGRLPSERIMHIARQVLKSLSEAHEQHIVHRDLKPENIFLSVVGDERDHVKVLDFGIAKIAHPGAADAVDESTRRLTLSGSTVGTPTYMSPEQAAGEEVDGRTDLYALAVIMYEMACGRPPFHDKEPVRVMRAHLFDPVPPLRDPALQGTILDRVIQKALAKDRDERFRNATEMLLALAGEPVARPMIRGISLHALDEPSTEDVRLEESAGPNTDDYDFNSDGTLRENRTSTLSFTRAVDGSRNGAADAVPFTSLSGRESLPGRNRETISGGFQTMDARSSVSSIITVISDGDDGEPILLTRKKTPEERSPAPEKVETEAQEPIRESDPVVGLGGSEVSSDLAETTSEAKRGGNWDWSQDGEVLKPKPEPRPSPAGGLPAWLIVLIVGIVVIALVGVFYNDVVTMMNRR